MLNIRVKNSILFWPMAFGKIVIENFSHRVFGEIERPIFSPNAVRPGLLSRQKSVVKSTFDL
jgi:hypothetical protein